MNHLAGVTLRPFQSEVDYEAIANLYLQCVERDNTEPASLLSRPQTAAEISNLAQWLGQPPRCLFIAEAEGSVIGFTVIGEWMDEYGRWSYLHRGLVHPAWRGRGLGTMLLHKAEHQLKQYAATHPTNGQAIFAAEAGASAESAALLTESGYQEVWCLAEYCCETSTAPFIAPPVGIEITMARSDDHLELWRVDNEIFGGSGEWDRHIAPVFEPSTYLVARSNTEVVGFCQYEHDHSIGAIAVLGVRLPWRRRGIGRALLAAAIRMLVKQGVEQVRTTASLIGEPQPNNLYNDLGFRMLRAHSWYQKPIDSDQFTFQWPAAEHIDIGGRHLHMVRAGAGSPTVVFDAGGSASSLVWRHILPNVAAFAQVIAFDRAGLGQSEPGPLPRSARTAVDDLHQMLAAAHIPRPYILVGHSMGGVHARLYASLYPAEVSGLVLIDSPHEEMLDIWRTLLAPDVWEQFIGSANYEKSDYILSLKQIKAAPALPDIPLIVLTARHGSYPYGWPREALDAVRVQLQGQIAQSAPQGRQIIVEDTGHEIQRDQPALIIDAIRQVMTR